MARLIGDGSFLWYAMGVASFDSKPARHRDHRRLERRHKQSQVTSSLDSLA